MKDHPSTLSRRSGIAQDRTTELKEAFDWALQILSLLRRLDGVLSATVKAWQSFTSAGGDIGYFHDPCTDATVKSQSVKARHRSLQNIHAKFRRLEEYQSKIAVLNKSCEDYQGTVSRSPPQLIELSFPNCKGSSDDWGTVEAAIESRQKRISRPK